MNNICGKCNGAFETDDLYVRHLCSETGFAPVMPEHQGEGFAAIQQAALARGEARKNV